MEISVKTLAGKAAGNITLDDAIFGIQEIRGDILQRTVRWQLARRQAGTHKVKSRAEVNRTTKKSIKQKGSGGARHGSRNAPIFVGGGIAHGPRVRSHAIGLNKKIRKMALAHALSSKVRESAILVIDEAKLAHPKTKDLVGHFAGLGIENALIISGLTVDENFARAASNIPNVDVLPVAGLNVYDILRRKTLVLTKEAAEGIKARFDGTLVQASPFSKDSFVDDIQLVDGIGPKTARLFRQAGVPSLTAFVAMPAAERGALLETMGSTEQAGREEWLKQAQEMIDGAPPRSRVDRDYAARQLAKRDTGA
jgi:large subunit ribosomal protein L4